MIGFEYPAEFLTSRVSMCQEEHLEALGQTLAEVTHRSIGGKVSQLLSRMTGETCYQGGLL